MADLSDDEIIAKCLLDIRKGLLDKNLKAIAAAYSEISGELIEIEEPKLSRLEVIRQKMASNTPLIKKSKTSKKKNINSEDIVNVAIKEVAEGEMKLITTEYNEEEAERNATMVDKTTRMHVVKRDKNIEDTSKTNGDVRFYKNPPPPSW